MKNKKTIFACLIGALLTVLVIVANAQNQGGSDALLGSWQVRIVAEQPGPPPFDELITFADGGGLVETNNLYPNPFFNQNASPGHGSWRFEGGGRYSFTFIKFLFDLQTNQFIGTLKATGTITVTGRDTWAGPAFVEIRDPAGNIVQSGLTSGSATRIVAGS